MKNQGTSDRCIAIIPARGNSKAIPKKNIINFCGKPLIAWTIEQAKKSKYIDRVYVSTDNKNIAKISKKYGAYIINRPASTATDKSPSESALLNALNQIRETPEYIVFLQATAPLRKADDIDNAIKEIKKNKADCLLSLTKAQEFIWKKRNRKFISLTFDYKHRRRRQELKPIYYENGSIYIFKPKILKRYNNRIGGKISIYLMEPWQRADIDDYETLGWCRWIYKKHMSGDNKKYA